MFSEPLQIFLESSTIWYVISCVVSILAVAFAFQYTKNIDTRVNETECDETKTEQEFGGGDTSIQDENKLFRLETLLPADKIPDELKKAKQKVLLHQLETNMSENQKIIEKKIQHEQLSEIFSLIEDQVDKFGINSVADMEEQMKLYRS